MIAKTSEGIEFGVGLACALLIDVIHSAGLPASCRASHGLDITARSASPLFYTDVKSLVL